LVTGIALFIILITTSCGNVKNFQYLQGSFDTTRLSKVQIPEAVIQKGDLLNISVFSDDPLSTAAVTRQTGGSSALTLTSEIGSSGSMNSAAATSGYLVDPKGEIQLYKLGVLHAEGLTKTQLEDSLEFLYVKEDLLKNLYVEVRFMNYKITVIGEVNRPGSINVPADKITAFEAIGLVGDITTTGRRDNVLVVREINGVRTFGRLNLKDPNVFLSPYYYLHQNDMVVVDVAKSKSTANNQSTIQYVGLAATLLSITAVIISLFRN
jgi:polysaccharide export outer membrane protein